MQGFSEKVSLIWSVANLLRGDYKPSEYGRVILPFLVMRRLDQVLAPTRAAVWEADAKHPATTTPAQLRERMLLRASKQSFFNTSKLDFTMLLADANHIAANLTGFVHGFSGG
jgi:type I restriction enzyme M protein